MDNFRSDIASSVLCNSQWTSLEELAQCYDTTLSQILDKHAPVNTKVLTVKYCGRPEKTRKEDVEIEITAG